MAETNPPSQQVRSTPYPSAAEFLNALATEQWTSDISWACPWVFRGQSSASWDLTPSAWRTPTSTAQKQLSVLRFGFAREFGSEIKERLDRNPLTKWANGDFVVMAYAQARAEFALLIQFIQLADELGHQVPNIDVYLRLKNHDYLPDIQKFPLLRLLPEVNAAAALAQHHGVPTRFLDFTRNPLYAAYFAASDVSGDGQTRDSIVVWALRPDLLMEVGRAEKFNSDYTRYLIGTVPAGENPYLRSQEGLFMSPTYGCAHIAKFGTFPRLEAFASEAQLHSKEVLIKKLTLPYSEVGELLRLLWLRGVSRAHLMPTLDNVTLALDGRWKWSF